MMDFLTGLPGWINAVSIIGNVLLALAILYLRTIFPTRADLKAETDSRAEAIETLDSRLGATERAISLLEQQARHAPTAADLQKMLTAMAELGGDVKAVSSRLGGVEKSLGALSRNVNMLVENELRGSAQQK